MSVRRRAVAVEGRAMAAWCAGPDAGLPPVVCVHGAGVSSRPHMPLVRALGERVRVWTVDLPGFGRSPAPPEPPSLRALGDALAGWLAAVDLPPVCLLGSSFGCQIAVDVAVRHRRHVRSLVLAGPTADPHARTWRATLRRWLRNTVREDPRMFPLNLADYRDCGTRRMLAAFAESLRDPLEDRLPRVDVPALVVRGEHDAIVPQAWTEEVTRLVPDARLAVVPGSPHMVPYRRPDALARLVEGFLRETAPKEAAGVG
ncbi:alpha/beta fold hydrolase [Actinomadura miaoliensis]